MQHYIMQAPRTPQHIAPGTVGPGPYADGLRDADWLQGPLPPGAGDPPAGTPVLYRWSVPAGESAAGLLFLPLDGNPRHGVLGLLRAGRVELLDAIEILERQGCWLVMPERARARLLASQLLARRGETGATRSSITGTPDRRFVFFNTLRDGSVVTLVERRKDGGVVLT